MEIELIDILIFLVPIMLINIYLSFKSGYDKKFSNSRFPIILISYSLLITIPIFILLVIFHVHIGNDIVFHIHDFQSDVLDDILTFEIDFIAMLIIGWCISILYSAFLISQLAMRLLIRYLQNFEITDINCSINLTEETKILLKTKKITLKFISNLEFGAIFSISNYTFFKKINYIYVNESILILCTNEEFNAAIIHEIGHINNMDTVFFPIFNTLNKFMFFDPFLRKINQKYKNKMEEKADYYAKEKIKDPKDLARVIVKCVDLINKTNILECQENSKRSNVLTLKSSDKNHLTMRIEKIIDKKSF
jgi:beta-lactamase regulating signal transducer with metallopeptidase domain